MSYLTESSKWNAYQFNDPFASDKFIVCNKTTKICCRPNCDLSLQTSLKSEVLFVSTAEEAVNAGFVKCPHCLISNDNNDLNTISIDVDLLIKAVATVNAQIGFVPPLDDDDPASQSIREAVMRKTKLRRGSVPAIHLNSATASKNTSSNITKNETDHVKLVDLACRHIALAAASTALQIHEDQNNVVRQQARQQEQQQQAAEDKANGNKKRRRRGGVLGFKELANKSRLSPWHFHRVFKSVTGLTPKVYGDKCWEFVKKYIERHGSFSSQRAITISTSITNPTSSPPDESTTGINTMAAARAKAAKPKSEENDLFSPSDSEQKHGSPFSTTMDDFIATPQSTTSVLGKSYASPSVHRKSELDFNQYSMLPATNDLLLDQPSADNQQVDSLFNVNDGVLNSLDILYNNQQPQFQDYHVSLQLPTQMKDQPTPAVPSHHLKSKSVPNPTFKDMDLPEFDLATATQNFNLYQTPTGSSFPFAADLSAPGLNDVQNFINNNMSNPAPAAAKANSDAGDYVQTPFNFDMNAYGYFGDFNALDPLETSRPTVEFTS